MLPYELPVKKYRWYDSLEIVDNKNRVVLDFNQDRFTAIEKRKQLEDTVDVLVELMNGTKFIQYNFDSKVYEVWEQGKVYEPKPEFNVNVEFSKRGNPNFQSGKSNPYEEKSKKKLKEFVEKTKEE